VPAVECESAGEETARLDLLPLPRRVTKHVTIDDAELKTSVPTKAPGKVPSMVPTLKPGVRTVRTGHSSQLIHKCPCVSILTSRAFVM